MHPWKVGHGVECFGIQVGRITSNSTLCEIDEVLQVFNFDFGTAVCEALNCLDAVCNCIHHLVGMDNSWVGDILVPKLNRVRDALVSC